MGRLVFGLLSLALLLPAPAALAAAASSEQAEQARSLAAGLESFADWWQSQAESGAGAETPASAEVGGRRATWRFDFGWLHDWPWTGARQPSQEAPSPSAPVQQPPALTPVAEPAPVPQQPSLAARVVELSNLERQKAGLPPLAVSTELTAAAQDYAEVLARGGCFGHQCGPVPNLAQRLENAGYTNWRYIGENIAAGQATPEEVVATWMGSPGHRANLLNPNFQEIGVGVAEGGPYGIYWVQEFGARR